MLGVVEVVAGSLMKLSSVATGPFLCIIYYTFGYFDLLQ